MKECGKMTSGSKPGSSCGAPGEHTAYGMSGDACGIGGY